MIQSNSNKIGDEQIGKAFTYDEIIKNIYGRKESFNFLFIGKAPNKNDYNIEN